MERIEKLEKMVEMIFKKLDLKMPVDHSFLDNFEDFTDYLFREEEIVEDEIVEDEDFMEEF